MKPHAPVLLLALALALPMPGCAALRFGAVGEVGALRTFAARSLVGESALIAGSATATVGVRVASVAAIRGSPFRAGGNSVSIIGSIDGKPIMRGLVQIQAGEIIVRDQYGKMKITAQQAGSRWLYYDNGGRQIAYSEQLASTNRIALYDISRGTPRIIGWDETVSGTRIRHYDAQGQYLGETTLSQTGDAGNAVVALAFVLADADNCLDAGTWESCSDQGLRALWSRAETLYKQVFDQAYAYAPFFLPTQETNELKRAHKDANKSIEKCGAQPAAHVCASTILRSRIAKLEAWRPNRARVTMECYVDPNRPECR